MRSGFVRHTIIETRVTETSNHDFPNFHVEFSVFRRTKLAETHALPSTEWNLSVFNNTVTFEPSADAFWRTGCVGIRNGAVGNDLTPPNQWGLYWNALIWYTMSSLMVGECTINNW